MPNPVAGRREDSSEGAATGLDVTLLAFEDLGYRDAFWPRRRYEDYCDRLALRAFLPPKGDRLIEVGAGFGRLADEYTGYREVVLLDPSETMLRAARDRLGSNSGISFVPGDAGALPFPDASFDVAVCVRVLHHLEDPGPAIKEIARVVRPGGIVIIESANKRNLKAIVAHLLRRGSASPFDRGTQPYVGVHFVPGAVRGAVRGGRATSGRAPVAAEWSATTSFVHAPKDLESWLRAGGCRVDRVRSVGLFRLPFLTGHVPLGLLTRLERVQQEFLSGVTPGPSMFLRAVRRPDRVPR
jgi:SAM-dependent methyltransferase